MQKKFDEIFEDVTKLGTKIKTDEYHKSGRHQIIDQGQESVAGYTDLEDGLFEDVPAIIFGDHTRIIKYVDQPFFLGADGVKVLRSCVEDANYRYLYYALKNVKIPNTGYNRHFKWLKTAQIKWPNAETQSEIVTALDGVSRIVEYRQQQLQKLNELAKARFVELFGDPYLNEFSWQKVKIKNAVTVEPQNGMYKPQSDYVTDGSGIPILRIDGFYDGVVTDFSSLKRLECSENERQKYLLYEDDVVINRVNSIEYLGKCAHINGLLEDTVYESNMMRMHFDPMRFHPVYVCHLLCSRYIYDQIVNHAKQAVNQASINQKDVLDFEIYEPPIELQEQFAAFVAQTDKSKVVESICKTNILFNITLNGGNRYDSETNEF